MPNERSHSLPVLNDSELRAMFAGDERAIWRYRLLAALRHEGLSPAQVARRFNTSPETVRDVAAAFDASGSLEALRSRRRGAAGHLRRQTPLAQAVAQELVATPDASSGEIYRRVQRRMAALGQTAPRRTVYRLIARLRPQREDDLQQTTTRWWPPALVPLLRAALPLLAADPPRDLGRSELAAVLVPDETDDLARGQRLRSLVQSALEALRPSAADPADPRWRAYTILAREALEGVGRETLERELAIAPATYSRAKRQGLEQMAEHLVRLLARQHAHIQHSAPPPAPPLVGRDQELAYYEQRLEQAGLALIWGVPGSGKTALAATLAARAQSAGQRVIWHTCTGQGEQLVAALLLSCGAPGETTRTLDELLAALSACWQGPTLLVLEHYERIADEPVADLLLAALRLAARNGQVRVLVVSRLLPAWGAQGGWLPLPGLTEDMTHALWNIFGGAPLDAERRAELYRRTLGVPVLVQVLATQPEPFLAGVICDQLRADLSPAAQRALHVLLLARVALTPEELRQLLPDLADDVWRELVRWGWVTPQQHPPRLHVHELLRTHRTELAAALGDPNSVLPALAAQAVADQRYLDAALHYATMGNAHAALQVIDEHAACLVARRDGPAAIELVRQITGMVHSGEHLALAQACLGALQSALGEHQAAIDALTSALNLAAAYGERVAPELRRRWHRWLAEAELRSGRWRHALAQAQLSMGGARTPRADTPLEERTLLILLLQAIALQAGQLDQARYWLAEAQMHLRIRSAPHLRPLLAAATGLLAAQQGDFEQALTTLRAVLHTWPAQAYQQQRIDIVLRLGRVYNELGQFGAAARLLRRALEDTSALSQRSASAELALTLAHTLAGQGHVARAWAMLQLGDMLLNSANAWLVLQRTLSRAWIELSEHAVAAASATLHEVIRLASEPPIPEALINANLGLAFAAFLQGAPSAATQYALRAQRLAEQAQQAYHGALASLCLALEATERHAWEAAQARLHAAEPCLATPLAQALAALVTMRLAQAQGDGQQVMRQRCYAHAALPRVPAYLRHWLATEIEALSATASAV